MNENIIKKRMKTIIPMLDKCQKHTYLAAEAESIG